MPRPKSKRKLRRLTLARARKRYQERKKKRIADLKAQSVSAVVAESQASTTPAATTGRRATVSRKPSA